MTTILSVQITVNEEKVSPARVTEEMVKGFVFLREGYFGLHEADLSLDISTITVTKPKRERHSRHVEKPDAPATLTQAALDAITWAAREESEGVFYALNATDKIGPYGSLEEAQFTADELNAAITNGEDA